MDQGKDLLDPRFDDVGQNLPPSAEELRILRKEVDKEKLYI